MFSKIISYNKISKYQNSSGSVTLSTHIPVPNACVILSTHPNQLQEDLFFRRKKPKFGFFIRKIKYFYYKNFGEILRSKR